MSNDQFERSSGSGSIPPVERVRQEVDKWIDAVRSTGERAMETLGLSATAPRPSNPTVDLIELADEIVVQVDLPGLTAETIELNLAGNMLSLSATRMQREFPADARFHLRERFIGKFNRTIPLPVAVDNDAIKAEMREGLLTITLKKAVSSAGRSIPISTGNS